MKNLLAITVFILLLTSVYATALAQNSSTKVFLGTTVEDSIPDIREHYKIKNGVLVLAVIENSSAQQAGIQVNDVLIGLNDSIIRSTPQFIGLVQAYTVGETVKLTLYRGGKKMIHPVLLKSRSENQIK